MKQVILAMFCILSLSVLANNMVTQTNSPTSDTSTSQVMGPGAATNSSTTVIDEKEQIREKQKMEVKDDERREARRIRKLNKKIEEQQ